MLSQILIYIVIPKNAYYKLFLIWPLVYMAPKPIKSKCTVCKEKKDKECFQINKHTRTCNECRQGPKPEKPETKKRIMPEDVFNHLKTKYDIPPDVDFETIKNEIEITGTFKHRKVELVKEGYDPKNISEPLYFCDHQSKKYIPLDNDLFGSINNQEMKL